MRAVEKISTNAMRVEMFHLSVSISGCTEQLAIGRIWENLLDLIRKDNLLAMKGLQRDSQAREAIAPKIRRVPSRILVSCVAAAQEHFRMCRQVGGWVLLHRWSPRIGSSGHSIT